MTLYLPRSAWTNHGPARPLTLMSAAPLQGFAVHWPGSGDQRIDAKDQNAIAKRLEGYRAYHVSNAPGHGWSDIAYQVAIDQAGRVWDCRGIKWQSAANGNQAKNKSHGAVLLLLGTKDAPSPAMIQAVQEWRKSHWLARYPNATKVVGHGDLWSTDCPGPQAEALVKNGSLIRNPPAPKPAPVPPKRGISPHINHLLNLEAEKKLTRAQAAELAAWRAGKTPAPPTATRKPLVTNYVFGLGSDIPSATAVAAADPGLLQVFRADDAKLAAAGANKVLVLGAPAVAALGLDAPIGATTVIGNYVVANGATGAETITRGLAGAQALTVG